MLSTAPLGLATLTPPRLLENSTDIQLISAAGCRSAPCTPLRALYSAVVVDMQPDASVRAPHGLAAGTWLSRFTDTTAGSALWQGLLDDLALAAGPSVANPRSLWLSVVDLPLSSDTVAGHVSSAECSSKSASNSSGGCACAVAVADPQSPPQGDKLHVPAVVLDLQLARPSRESAERIVATFKAGLTRLHRLGVDVCIQDADGAVVGDGCGEPAALPPAVPPPPASCTNDWTTHLYRGVCATAPEAGSLLRPQAPAVEVLTTAAINFSKAACGDTLSGFPAGWRHGYCGAAAAHVCVPEAQVVRLLLRLRGGSAALSVNGKLEVGMAADGGAIDGNSVRIGEIKEGEAVLGLASGCHRFEIIFEDSARADSGNAQVRLPQC